MVTEPQTLISVEERGDTWGKYSDKGRTRMGLVCPNPPKKTVGHHLLSVWMSEGLKTSNQVATSSSLPGFVVSSVRSSLYHHQRNSRNRCNKMTKQCRRSSKTNVILHVGIDAPPQCMKAAMLLEKKELQLSHDGAYPPPWHCCFKK